MWASFNDPTYVARERRQTARFISNITVLRKGTAFRKKLRGGSRKLYSALYPGGSGGPKKKQTRSKRKRLCSHGDQLRTAEVTISHPLAPTRTSPIALLVKSKGFRSAYEEIFRKKLGRYHGERQVSALAGFQLHIWRKLSIISLFLQLTRLSQHPRFSSYIR